MLFFRASILMEKMAVFIRYKTEKPINKIVSTKL